MPSRPVIHEDASVFSEIDHNTLVGEESSLLRETSVSSTLGSAIPGLIGLPSPQVASCLDEVERSIYVDGSAKRRAGQNRNNVLGSLDSSFNSTGTMTPDTDTSGIYTTMSPNARHSISETSASNIDRTEPDRVSDPLEVIYTALRAIAGERSIDARTSNRMRPVRTRAAQPGNSHVSSETTGSPAGSSSRFSSVRWAAPPLRQSPRQSRTPLSPTNLSSPLPRSPEGLVDPAFASSKAKKARAPRQGGSGSMNKCMVFNDSTVNGPTINNDGSHNLGSVVVCCSRRIPTCPTEKNDKCGSC